MEISIVVFLQIMSLFSTFSIIAIMRGSFQVTVYYFRYNTSTKFRTHVQRMDKYNGRETKTIITCLCICFLLGNLVK
jgi:hypothetical protein